MTHDIAGTKQAHSQHTSPLFFDFDSRSDSSMTRVIEESPAPIWPGSTQAAHLELILLPSKNCRV